MPNQPDILRWAQAYLQAGLCVLPARRTEKRPAVGRWKQYQKRLPTVPELSAWMANNPDAVCILCGVSSNNVEIIDFDAGGELFSAWWDRIPADLRDRLVIEGTPSGGWHVIYHCVAAVCGNLKLAQRRVGEKTITLIETRGEGGLFLCAPTAGYKVTQGDLANPPVLTADERDVLLQAAWELNEYLPPAVNGPKGSANIGLRSALSVEQGKISADHSDNGCCSTENGQMCDCPSDNGHSRPMSVDISHLCGLSADDADNRHGVTDNAHIHAMSAENSHRGDCSSDNGMVGQTSPMSVGSCGSQPEMGARPGDDFNHRGDVRALLRAHGWTLVKGGDNEYWRRPGKDSGTSATLKERVFYVFSSNATPFEPNQGYSPFSVYTLLEHGGDYEQAARCLRTMGFGSDCPADNTNGVDISAIVRKGPPSLADIASDGPDIQRLKTLIDEFGGLNRPIIHELLREGETMNIIASPKVGKSWFVSHLAISIASGLDWLGLTVEPGRVLHIDNELHTNTIAYRYRVISEAMGFPHHLYSGNIDMVSLRGRLHDLYGLARMFEGIEPGQYKLIILDAFYRTLPRDTDENDNGAIANLYNVIDHCASRLGCAFVLIHHTSKGNQSGKAVTDVGAGAGSQSRAADTHLILRPHEEEGIIILDSAVRSWPPMPPKALKWNWPLFTPTDTVDTSALLGAAKSSKPKTVGLDEFVEQCIAINDPCSKRSVGYEANQQFSLSERKAEEMLELAMERGLVSRIRAGSRMVYVKNRPGANGEKGLWTAALIAHDPSADTQGIADVVGVSRQYVNQVRRAVFGNSPETAGN